MYVCVHDCLWVCAQDWEGNPTNPYIQKDASEFLGMLFQQMEMKVQGSPQEHVIKQCFGGTQQNELIADGKYSAREEPFTFLSLDIKNRKVHHTCLQTSFVLAAPLICCCFCCSCIPPGLVQRAAWLHFR